METVRRFTLAVVIAFTLMIGQAWADEVSLYVNGQQMQTDTAPILDNGTTMVPVRFVSEALGAQVVWDAETQSVFVSGPTPVAMMIGSKQASKEGKTVELLHEPVIVNGRTMVPVRFIAEAMGCTVNWGPGKVMIIKLAQQQVEGVKQVLVYEEGVPVDSVKINWH